MGPALIYLVDRTENPVLTDQRRDEREGSGYPDDTLCQSEMAQRLKTGFSEWGPYINYRIDA